ncbi:MAG: hypothetical protein L3J63_03450 [Geopsychrobacter sp.]|nr:hypothetical protein [Geopsychrobacter sp.]
MSAYEIIDVSEQELEDLVRRFASQIEGGLVYVDHQKKKGAWGSGLQTCKLTLYLTHGP